MFSLFKFLDKIWGGADIENGSFVPSDMNATKQVILEHSGV